MWGKMKQLAKKVLFGPLYHNDFEGRLNDARNALDKEANKLNSEVQVMGNKNDPIEVIIKNIKKVKGQS